MRPFRPVLMAAAAALLLASAPAIAGPPYLTDDPEPVERNHYEFYIASQFSNMQGGYFATACSGGSLDACIDLGLMCERQNRDLDKVAALYKRACDGKVVIGCVHLGRAYAKGLGVAQDLDKAEALFKAACAEKSAFGCNDLAMVAITHDGWPDKGDAIKKSLEARCKANDAAACYTLAVVLETGRGGTISADPVRAKDLLKKACDGGSVGGCLEKARVEREGI